MGEHLRSALTNGGLIMLNQPYSSKVVVIGDWPIVKKLCVKRMPRSPNDWETRLSGNPNVYCFFVKEQLLFEQTTQIRILLQKFQNDSGLGYAIWLYPEWHASQKSIEKRNQVLWFQGDEAHQYIRLTIVSHLSTMIDHEQWSATISHDQSLSAIYQTLSTHIFAPIKSAIINHWSTALPRPQSCTTSRLPRHHGWKGPCVLTRPESFAERQPNDFDETSRSYPWWFMGWYGYGVTLHL